MSIAIKRAKIEHFTWAATACMLCYCAVKIIVYQSVFWVAVLVLPVLVYLSLRKPFIFPFGAYVFLLPFDSLLSVTGHTQGATLTKILGIMTIMALLLKGSFESRFVRPDKAVLCWTLLVLYAASTFVWAIDPVPVLARMPTALGLLAFYLAVSFYGATENEWNTLKTAILLGGFLASTFSIYAYYSGSFYDPQSQRATLLLGNRETNPNYLGFGMLIPTSICIGILFEKGKFNWKRISSVLILGALFFCVILSGSRGTMLGIGIIVAVFLLSSKRKFSLALLLTAILLPMILLTLQSLMERWQIAYSSGGAGRLEIWQVGLKAFGSYWLGGAGMDNFPTAYTKFVDYGSGFEGFYRASHNIYLGCAVELGAIGLLGLLWGFKRHYALILSNSASGEKKDKTMLMAAFWAILAASIFGDYFWDKAMWLFWMMVLLRHNMRRTRGFIQSAGYAGSAKADNVRAPKLV